jgi:hypothetical protein
VVSQVCERVDRPVAGPYLDIGWRRIVLIKGIDCNSDRGIACLDVKRRRGVERALDRTVSRVDADLVTNKTLKGNMVGVAALVRKGDIRP